RRSRYAGQLHQAFIEKGHHIAARRSQDILAVLAGDYILALDRRVAALDLYDLLQLLQCLSAGKDLFRCAVALSPSGHAAHLQQYSRQGEALLLEAVGSSFVL